MPRKIPPQSLHESASPPKAGRKSGATFFEVDGAVPVTWSASEIAGARAACPALLKGLNLVYKPVEPIGGPGGCGAAAPIEVSEVAGMAIRPPATLTCTFANILHKWARGALQQAAKAAMNEEIASLHNVASYTCRKRRGDGSGKISEHGLSNALDIAGFQLKSGGSVSVSADWGPIVRNDTRRSDDPPSPPLSAKADVPALCP